MIEQQNTASIMEELFTAWKKKTQPYYVINTQAQIACYKASVKCLENAISPDVWFLAQIEGLNKREQEKFKLQELYSARALNKAILYQRKYFTQPDPADMFEECIAAMADAKDFGYGSIEQILSDKKRDFPAWFRIAYTEERCAKIIETYREQAVRELIRDPRIEQFIIANLPEDRIKRIKYA